MSGHSVTPLSICTKLCRGPRHPPKPQANDEIQAKAQFCRIIFLVPFASQFSLFLPCQGLNCDPTDWDTDADPWPILLIGRDDVFLVAEATLIAVCDANRLVPEKVSSTPQQPSPTRCGRSGQVPRFGRVAAMCPVLLAATWGSRGDLLHGEKNGCTWGPLAIDRGSGRAPAPSSCPSPHLVQRPTSEFRLPITSSQGWSVRWIPAVSP